MSLPCAGQLDLPLDSSLNLDPIKSPDQRWNGSERGLHCRGCGQIERPARAYFDPTHGIKVALCDSDHGVRAKSDSASSSGANTAIKQQGGSHV